MMNNDKLYKTVSRETKLSILRQTFDHLFNSIETCIKRGNKGMLTETLSFIDKSLKKAIDRSALSLFEKYIFLPSRYYDLGYKYKVFNDILTDNSSFSIYCIIKHYLYDELKTKMDVSRRKVLIKFVNMAFTGFNELIYNTIRNIDISSYKTCIERFNNLRPLYLAEQEDYEYEASFELLSKSDKPLDAIKLQNLTDIYNSKKEFYKYYRHINLGIFSWLVYLYHRKEITFDILNEFINEVDLQYYSTSDLISDLLFCKSLIFKDYLNWNMWEICNSGSSFRNPAFFESPKDWLTFGISVYLIMNNNITFSIPDKLPENNEISILSDEFSEIYRDIGGNYAHWEKLLRKSDFNEFNLRSMDIIEFFKKLRQKYDGDIDLEIVNQKISEKYLLDFKNIIGTTWKRNAVARNIFLHYKNYTVPEKKDLIPHPGFFVYFAKAKMMFVEKYHQHIYGMEAYGGKTARMEDNLFLMKLVESTNIVKNKTNALAIDSGIKELKEAGYEPNIILASSNLSLSDRSLIVSGNFTPHWEKKLDINGVRCLGFYKNIPIISIFSPLITSKIIIADFSKAFLMEQLRDSNWFEDQLKIEVTEINDEDALKKYYDEKEKWERDVEGNIVDMERALISIKTGVCIKVFSYCNFLIIKKDAYSIHEVSNV